MCKYGTIAKVILCVPGGEKVMSHLLLTDNNDFQVDLTGDFFFNELPVLTVLGEARVESLEDVYEYLCTYNIEEPSGTIKDEGLIVGGERDFLINHELLGGWCQNLS